MLKVHVTLLSKYKSDKANLQCHVFHIADTKEELETQSNAATAVNKIKSSASTKASTKGQCKKKQSASPQSAPAVKKFQQVAESGMLQPVLFTRMLIGYDVSQGHAKSIVRFLSHVPKPLASFGK